MNELRRRARLTDRRGRPGAEPPAIDVRLVAIMAVREGCGGDTFRLPQRAWSATP